MKKDFFSLLVEARPLPFFGHLSYYILKALGVELPRSVVVGPGLELVHGGFGVVVHSRTVIGKNVKIYPGVTLGRADIYLPFHLSKFEKIVVEDDVILSPGCKVLCKEGVLRIAQGTVIGANAVLLTSTSPNEIWVGMPARCIGMRPTVIMHPEHNEGEEKS